MKTQNTNKYQEIANNFANLLEKSNGKWSKGWKNTKPSLPSSYITKNVYSGLNLFNLLMVQEEQQFNSCEWITFPQAKEKNIKIKKGSKGVPLLYFKKGEEEQKEEQKEKEECEQSAEIAAEEESKSKSFARWFTVFNIEQCENVPEDEEKECNFSPIEEAEKLLNKFINFINFKSQNRAFYSHNDDMITLPTRAQFKSVEEFYYTAFHEIAHWTGKRLGRKYGEKGTEQYAKEELIAEITSIFIGARTGIGSEANENNIAYIKSWASKIREDSKYLFNAVKEADTAFKYILNY